MCDLLNYRDWTRCTREIKAVWDYVLPIFFLLRLFWCTISVWRGKSRLPPHPPAVSEMSVYRDTIDKRIVLPCDFTLRFHETDGGSSVNYQSAFKLRLAPKSIDESFNLHIYSNLNVHYFYNSYIRVASLIQYLAPLILFKK